MFVVLQSSASPAAVVGTFLALVLFFTLTAHVAARNVLGDVELKRAPVVGFFPPVISFVFVALSWPSWGAVGLAALVDLVAIRYVYRRDWGLSGYVTFIHAVVSLILGAVLFSLLALVVSFPGA